MIDARWASVARYDNDGDFLVLEVPPSQRGSVEIGSLGGAPNPREHGFGGMGTQIRFVGLEPKMGVLHLKELGQNQVDFE